ncbi:hypothetical protein FPV67DRAFT_1567427 [Lyophyllum atratum]|nr:hypothetical protein FPV67DRAFT_1567427 [Lyophyllum atratum]
MSQPPVLPEAAAAELLDEFRQRFHRFRSSIVEAVNNSADTVVLWRLGDDLQQYVGLVNEYASIFPPEELALIQHNLAIMQNDVRQQYDQATNESHHGQPVIVETVHTGHRGRPQIHIDPEFLRWAYSMRSTSSIARFLGVGRRLVRDHLLQYGIAEAREQPSVLSAQYIEENNDFLDPQGQAVPIDNPPEVPQELAVPSPNLESTTHISVEDLDALLLHLRQHFRRAGITMLDGMLRRLGHRVPRERIKQSLIRIDPVHRVFQRIKIRRRVYSVPGPNSLWHHDGQHGTSVHNVRIERLWVDVTAQVGATWAELFTLLEIRHGLDINNPQHIWLLHFLFLGTINQQLDFFAQSWNQHRIQIRGGPNRSPADMFGFDMIVHGVRGYQLPRLDDSTMTEEELEVFGMDWEGLREDNLLQSREANNPRNEDSGSWLGRVGPPEHLNEVPLHAPQDVYTYGNKKLF